MRVYRTKQRSVLLDYLLLHADHPVTAGQIAGELQDKKISLSAVYRNLSALCEDGTVQKRPGGDGEVFYQYTVKNQCLSHLHLSCKKCGKIFHMPLSESDGLIQKIADNDDFQVDRAETVLYGLCKNCKS